MLLPSSCLHFGPPQNHNVTAGTSQTDQAQHIKELKNWVEQQEATLRFLYGEEVEFYLRLCCWKRWRNVSVRLTGQPWISCQVRADPLQSSKPCRPHHNRSTPAVAATPAELGTPTAVAVEPSSPPPAGAEFPAGYSSWPGRRPRRRAVATGKVRVGASYVSTEDQPATAPLRLSFPEFVGSCPALGGRRSSERPPTPAWVLARLQFVNAECMKERCMECVPHMLAHPQDLLEVHAILQVEFLEEGWLYAPAPLSAGGPFMPLLKA
ncbi:hypothetical protein CRENBAI_009609, partial [Crenichthys baileyi]